MGLGSFRQPTVHKAAVVNAVAAAQSYLILRITQEVSRLLKVPTTISTKEAPAKQAGNRASAQTVQAPQLIFSAPIIIQRKCACGGECPSCLEEKEEPLGIQTKLSLGPAYDSYEQEADRIAAQVLRMPAPSPLTHLEDSAARLQHEITPLVRTSSGPERELNELQDEETRVIEQGRDGVPLPESVRAYMEPRFGADFSAVRLHTNAESARMNNRLHSQAFTHGRDIWLGRGETAGNLSLLAHELTHVVQQSQAIERENELKKRHPDLGEAANSIEELQHYAGNQTMQDLFRSGTAPGKLPVSNPEDVEEQDAEHLSETALAGDTEGLSPVAAKGPSQSSSVSSGPVNIPGIVGEVLRKPGTALDSSTRAFFESRLGKNFSDVRIHTGPEAASSARSLDAQAYTLGSHVVFSGGRFHPESNPGRKLLAHELVHTGSPQSSRSIMRKPEKDAPPLDVDVPEPDPSFAPQWKYPWQHPDLRKSIYPYRDEELSFFLRTYMEIDLENPSMPLPPASADEVAQERKRLKEQLDPIQAALNAAIKAKDEAAIKDLSPRAHRLKADLDYLPSPKGVSAKSLARKWAAYRYSKLDDQGNDLDHDALLARVVARFDSDPNFQRYPKWLRYMVFHFSGMRYQSAHGSYAPATDVIKRLKHDEVVSHTSAEKESDVATQSADAIKELEAELATTNKSNAKRRLAIQSRLTSLRALEAVQQGAFSKKGSEERREAFLDLTRLEEQRDNLNGELAGLALSDPAADPKRKELEQVERQIAERETQIGPELKSVRKQMEAAKLKRRGVLIEHEIERADKAVAQLDDMQALSILKTMRDKNVFPEWVWKEIVRVTALKLEIPEGTDWETVTAEEKKEKKAADPVTKRWRQVMEAWKKDTTGWREKHGNDLSLVVIRAVCNEICEMALHARGVSPAGGIAQKAKWYGAKSGGRSLSRPTKQADLKPGASLLFMEWSDVPAKGPESIVRSDLGVELRSEKGAALSDGLQEPGGFAPTDKWTYHFNSDKTVTRSAPIESVTDPKIKPREGLMHLNWKHEAMIVEVDAPGNRVVTFETGPIGLRIRWLKNVLDQWNVLVGFAESTKDREGIDDYLKDILPSPTTTPKPPSNP